METRQQWKGMATVGLWGNSVPGRKAQLSLGPERAPDSRMLAGCAEQPPRPVKTYRDAEETPHSTAVHSQSPPRCQGSGPGPRIHEAPALPAGHPHRPLGLTPLSPTVGNFDGCCLSPPVGGPSGWLPQDRDRWPQEVGR